MIDFFLIAENDKCCMKISDLICLDKQTGTEASACSQ
jgi:hypothetical protein